MKFFSRITVFIVGILSCFGCTSSYELEDQVCACFEKEVDKQGQDYYQLLNEIEAYYIDQKVLASSDGKSYKAKVTELSKDGVSANFQSTLPERIKHNFELLLTEDVMTCYLNNDLLKDSNTKYAKLLKDIGKLVDSKNSNVNIVFDLLDKSLTTKDFEHPLYKYYFFSLYYGLMNFSIELDYGIGYKEGDERDVISSNNNEINKSVLHISVDANDRIWVENDSVSLDELNEKIMLFYTANSDAGNANFSYPFYDKIDTTICNVEIARLKKEIASGTRVGYNEKKVKTWEKNKARCYKLENNTYNVMVSSSFIQLTFSKRSAYGKYTEIQKHN